MSRHDDAYLNDILEAVRSIQRGLEGFDLEMFLVCDWDQTAVYGKLVIIGEAANQLSQDLRDRYPEIPWRRYVDMRNVLAHQYHGIDWSIVWRVATTRLPEFAEKIERILER